jgi:hypothetical protein
MTMSLSKLSCCVLLFCIPHVVGSTETSTVNRWDLKARQKGITPIQRQAYEQLAKLHDYRGEQLTQWDSVFYLHPRPNPMTNLRDMDVRAIPILAEALDDSTPTQTVNRLNANISPWKGEVHIWKVNELVALLIRDIASHEFVLGEWGDGIHLRDINSHRDRIPEFRKRILEWYARNKDKTLEDRRIADLQSNLRNRLDATRWLGEKKSVKAIPHLARRIETTQGERQTSSTDAELAEISLALGRIGNTKSYPAVKKACEQLSVSSPNSPGSNAIRNLFRAYEGMAMLGHKKEALAELKRIYEKHGVKMEPATKAEYEKQLSAAATW